MSKPDPATSLTKIIENVFEFILWKSRLVIILAVVFSLLGAIGLFVVGSYEILHTMKDIFPFNESLKNYEAILIGIIGAIDLYLIGIVLLLFSFGIYELFISKIDVARFEHGGDILDIGSLDELKNKILKVIIMVLIVSFFKGIIQMHFQTALEMLYFALSIVMLAAAVYLLRKKEDDKEGA